MPLPNLRELLQLPGGDNATDTVVNGVHFNRSALDHFNYTVYDNGTISNRSKCFLVFDQYQPSMLSNGSWVNGTSCYLPYYGIRTRAKVGIVFAALYAISIMFTLVNLRKHGRMFLREDKRFRIIGRRWQWYWMCFVAACGIISTITGIDVDRDYLQSIAIVLQGFFFSLMLPGTLAMVWEATRHWGSWQERQICDRDPFLLPQDDRRGRVEFYLPLIFYLFAWLNFFMTIPRSWTNIEYQRSPWQTTHYAAPTATDARFKAAAILAICAWLTTIYSLHHSLSHYHARPRLHHLLTHTPPKLALALALLTPLLAYTLASATTFHISILSATSPPAYPYALGHGPVLLLLLLFNVFGYVDENEDRVLLAQRRERGREVDGLLGVAKKPSWWRKGGEAFLTPDQRLRALAGEDVGGGPPTARNIAANLELGNMRVEHGGRREEDPFGDAHAVDAHTLGGGGGGGGGGDIHAVNTAAPGAGGDGGRGLVPLPPLPRTDSDSDNASARTGETGETGLTGVTMTENLPPQRIRSMLDV